MATDISLIETDTCEPQVQTLRIAIITTPRTGNTWLRQLLGTVYSLPNSAVERPEDIDWEGLPERCAIAVHWHPEPHFVAMLEQYGFHVVTMCRHPLDILISILHFASACSNAERFTQRWLDEEGGNECGLLDSIPTDAKFLKYASSERARRLFSVSREWSAREGCTTAHYERLVQDPVAELTRICDELEPAPAEAIRAAIQANTIDKLRRGVDNQHHWQGSPGIWRHLLTAERSREIANLHADFMAAFGYTCEPDEKLELSKADGNWFALELVTLRREIVRLQTTQERFLTIRADLDTANYQLQDLDTALHGTYNEFNVTRTQFLALTEETRAIQNAIVGVQEDLHGANGPVVALNTAFQGTYGELVALRHQLESLSGEIQGGRVEAADTRNLLTLTREELNAVQRELAEVQGDFAAARRDFNELRDNVRQVPEELKLLRAHLDKSFNEFHGQLTNLHLQVGEFQKIMMRFVGIGPKPLWLARKMSNLSHRLSKAKSAAVSRLSGMGLGRGKN